MKWINMNRDLTEDEIVRMKIRKPNNPPKEFDGYIYGRADGGFGMQINTIGSAVFVKNESWTYDECLNRSCEDLGRWHRSDIEIMSH